MTDKDLAASAVEAALAAEADDQLTKQDRRQPNRDSRTHEERRADDAAAAAIANRMRIN